MMDTVPDKTFFRIGEVSRILGVPPYVIRYWESEFKAVKPSRTRSDQRLYRRHDVESLLVIKRLLYEEKFTIDGARRHLRRTRREEADPGSSRLSHGEIIEELKNGLLWIREKVG
jgi:DNA-binding transcriptional MerR regulator